MNTLKSGPSSDSADSVLFILGSGGGAVMLKNESNPSPSPKPVVAVSDPATDESPQTVSGIQLVTSCSKIYFKLIYHH